MIDICLLWLAGWTPTEGSSKSYAFWILEYSRNRLWLTYIDIYKWHGFVAAISRHEVLDFVLCSVKDVKNVHYVAPCLGTLRIGVFWIKNQLVNNSIIVHCHKSQNKTVNPLILAVATFRVYFSNYNFT